MFYLNHEGVPSAMLMESSTNKKALWINDNYTEKESRAKRLFLFFTLLISFLLLSSFFIYSTVWLIQWFFIRDKKTSV